MQNYNIRIEKFHNLYKSLSLDSIPRIDSLYSPKMVFIDPVHRIEDRNLFKDYLINLLEPLNYCNFEIHSFINDGENSSAFWTMKFSHKSFYNAKEIQVNGSSQLKWEGDQIIFHRDYFDLGQMLYEKIPLLGRLIVWIKGKLT